MVGRSPARFLAPLALLGVVLALVLVMHRPADSSSPSPSQSAADIQHAAPHHAKRTYVVRSGDTLSTIAADAGISLPALQKLNPEIDPNAIRPGQRLRLRP